MSMYIGRFRVTPLRVVLYAITLVVAYVVGVLIGVLILGTPSQAHAADAPVARIMRFMTHPCENEDSNNCYWDAQKRNFVGGHSFYALRVGNQDCLKYWEPAYNIKHGKCYPHVNGKVVAR